MAIGKSAGGQILKHLQVNALGGTETEVFAEEQKGAVYGFLVESQSDDPLFLNFKDTASGDVVMSFDVSTKFGRDGQTFALRFFPAGCFIQLSTSRTAASAPAGTATVHVWYDAQQK